jgi:hypothetical protein
MDPNTPYYYALSTIAQCAAALAALIGFLGLWKLDRLRREAEQIEPSLEEWVVQEHASNQRTNLLFELEKASKDMDIITHRREKLLWQVRHALEPKKQGELRVGQWEYDYPGQRIEAAANRLEALLYEQRHLILVISVFLAVTLMIILPPAIVGIVHVEWLRTQAWTPWLLYAASAWLACAPVYVVLQAARGSKLSCVVLSLLLALASPVPAAGPVRCTIYEEKTMQRWQTCTGQMNPRTQQVEVRCR